MSSLSLSFSTNDRHFEPKNLFCVDSVDERLERARTHHGATPLHLERDDPKAAVLAATGGRGADIVLEIVGHESALRLAFDLVRPGGFIHSVGMHHAPLPIGGLEAYNKVMPSMPLEEVETDETECEDAIRAMPREPLVQRGKFFTCQTWATD